MRDPDDEPSEIKRLRLVGADVMEVRVHALELQGARHDERLEGLKRWVQFEAALMVAGFGAVIAMLFATRGP